MFQSLRHHAILRPRQSHRSQHYAQVRHASMSRKTARRILNFVAHPLDLLLLCSVVTAFFVQAFVTKLDDETIVTPANANTVARKAVDSSLRASENASF